MENSKQKNSVVMKSQSNNKQGLSKLIPLHQVRNTFLLFGSAQFLAEPARSRVSGAPLLRKFGNLSSQEILVVT